MGGMPMDSRELFASRGADLERARAHRLGRYDASRGTTLWEQFGEVTATYTCVEGLSDQGSGCSWRVRYVSDGCTIIWVHRSFNRRGLFLMGSDIFTVFPP